MSAKSPCRAYSNHASVQLVNLSICGFWCTPINTFCIPDKDIRVFYLDRQFLSHRYLTQHRIKSRVFNTLVVQEVQYLRLQVTFDLKKMTSLYANKTLS